MAMFLRHIMGPAIDSQYIGPHATRHRDAPRFFYTQCEQLRLDLLGATDRFLPSPVTDKNLRAYNIRAFLDILNQTPPQECPSEQDKAIMLLPLGLFTSCSDTFARYALSCTIKIIKPVWLGTFHPVSIGKKAFHVDHKLRCDLTYILPTWSEQDVAATYILEQDLKKCGFTAINSKAIADIIAAKISNSVLEAPHTLQCIWSLRKDSLFAKFPRDIVKIIIGYVKCNFQASLITQIQEAAQSRKGISLFSRLIQISKRILWLG